MVQKILDVMADKRYRSRKWIGFLLITILTAVFTWYGKEMSDWLRWATIGYPAFCAANAILKYNDKES